jgi:hypothetical protein
MDKAQLLFNSIWKDYTQQNPEVQEIHNLFVKQGEKVVNDHIAFRTFNDPRVNIDVLSKAFVDRGYVYRGDYHFNDKHLYARHFEFKEFKNAPRVFISELKLEEMSAELQLLAKACVDKVSDELIKSPDLLFSGRSWGKPSYKIYVQLRLESEYAAWVYVFGFRANHFTVSVNALKKLNTLQKVNQFLKEQGFKLNSAGGEIKGGLAELLEQSSTKASIQNVEFEEGVYAIPSSYYEFAKRYPDQKGQLYGGFIAQSANKIFESTDFYKKD